MGTGNTEDFGDSTPRHTVLKDHVNGLDTEQFLLLGTQRAGIGFHNEGIIAHQCPQ